jgi:hypothetical protein
MPYANALAKQKRLLYTVVGISPAYVHGIMYDEAVEGVQLAPERDFYVPRKGRWTIQNVQLH